MNCTVLDEYKMGHKEHFFIIIWGNPLDRAEVLTFFPLPV